MSVSRVREGRQGRTGGEERRGQRRWWGVVGGWEAVGLGRGGVSVQFTNTTVNSEAGQDTEQAGGGVRKRLLVQECH